MVESEIEIGAKYKICDNMTIETWHSIGLHPRVGGKRCTVIKEDGSSSVISPWGVVVRDMFWAVRVEGIHDYVYLPSFALKKLRMPCLFNEKE